MFQFLKRKTKIAAPVGGICIPLEEVNDSVFSSKMLGDGFAVAPSEDTVTAPVAGEIVMIAESKHAFGIRTSSGWEVMVHIGLDTVELEGEGFTRLSDVGKKAEIGTPMIKVDREKLTEKGYDLTTMVIITKGNDSEIRLDCYGREVQAGEVLVNG